MKDKQCIFELFSACTSDEPKLLLEAVNNQMKRTWTEQGTPLNDDYVGVSNNDCDNSDNHLIVRMNEMIDDRYKVTRLLGKGGYGIVVEAVDSQVESLSVNKNHLNLHVAIKIVRNLPNFESEAKDEIRILEDLNQKFERNGKTSRIVHFLRSFWYKSHICMVFECLGMTLLELLQWRNFQGLPLDYIRPIAEDFLVFLSALKKAKILHCDIKPENVLLLDNNVLETNLLLESEKLMDENYVNKNLENYSLKIIDFGTSRYYEKTKLPVLITSRWYRAPEILLGIEYDYGIDLWSFGCLLAELWLGYAICPGCSNYDQILKISDFLGSPNPQIIKKGKLSKCFFEEEKDDQGNVCYSKMKSEEQYIRDLDNNDENKWTYMDNLYGIQNLFSRRFSRSLKSIRDTIISSTPFSGNVSKTMEENRKFKDFQIKQKKLAISFCDFLDCILKWDPSKRWSCEQLLEHPFITD